MSPIFARWLGRFLPLGALAVAAACADIELVALRAGSAGDGGTGPDARPQRDGGAPLATPDATKEGGTPPPPPSCATGCVSPTAVCDAQGDRCVACTVDAHCAGTSRGHCDPVAGRCVECTIASDCGPGFVCRRPTGTCALGCAVDADCPEGVCDVARGACTQCQSDRDCTDGERGLCNTTLGRCVECNVDADCTEGGRCDPGPGRCRQCLTAADCGGGEVCDPEEGQCRTGCSGDGDCGDSEGRLCLRDARRCVECVSSGDCADSSRHVCLIASHTCAECATDSDCPNGTRCNVASAECR